METSEIRINISKGFEQSIQEAFKTFAFNLTVGNPNAEAAFTNAVEVACRARDIALQKFR